MTTTFVPPAWAFEIHGHQCPFMPLGYRMGRLAMEKLGVEREPDFVDAMGRFPFFAFCKQSMEHSQISVEARDEILNRVYEQADDFIFALEARPDFKFTPVKGSFNKIKCCACGDYVFERYVRTKDGQPVCIPCAGY